MRTIIQNILSNSIKYTSKKTLAKINVKYKSNKKEHLISFTDNGVGFNMEYNKNVFKMFNRMHSDSEFEGAGIGLAIVKSAVLKQGGRVTIFSKENKGSTITLYLPK